MCVCVCVCVLGGGWEGRGRAQPGQKTLPSPARLCLPLIFGLALWGDLLCL